MSNSDVLRPDELATLAVLLGDDRLDDDLLVGRMKNVVFGNTHPDPEGETVDEQSKLILISIKRQLQNNCASRAALGYIAHCLDRYLCGLATSLDEAFYLKHKRPPGGQVTPAEVERATVRAYMGVIRPATQEFDSSIKDYIYSRPSKEVRREAYQAAYSAYRKAKGKETVDDHEPEKKINQTIKPILRRMNVLK